MAAPPGGGPQGSLQHRLLVVRGNEDRDVFGAEPVPELG